METVATQRRRYYNAAERAEWISLYRSSQLPASQFTQQYGLKLETLCRWLRQERPSSSPSPVTAGFQEVRLPSLSLSHTWAAEIAFPGGVVVRLGATATASWMASLFQALRQAC
jgi:hypothetical protein